MLTENAPRLNESTHNRLSIARGPKEIERVAKDGYSESDWTENHVDMQQCFDHYFLITGLEKVLHLNQFIYTSFSILSEMKRIDWLVQHKIHFEKWEK